MFLKAFAAWLRSFFTKDIAQLPGVPPGVRLATREEAATSVAEYRSLPVVTELCRHGTESSYPRELEAKLWEEYKRAYEVFQNDYSCGVAMSLIRGSTSGYEPLDVMRKVSDHLVAFLKSQGIEAAV